MTLLHTCPALRLRWCPSTSPFRCQDCCLPVHAHRWLSARFPSPILLSTIIHFSEFSDAACVLASPLLRTPHLCDRPSVRLPTWWLASGRVGLDGFRYLTHWVTLMSFKGYHPYSLAPDFSRHERVLVSRIHEFGLCPTRPLCRCDPCATGGAHAASVVSSSPKANPGTRREARR